MLVYIPSYSSCFSPGWYYKTLVFDLIFKWARENLSDGGHDKIIWKRIRDLLTRRPDNVTLRRGGDVPNDVIGYFIWDLQETSWIRTTETSWWRTSEMSLGVPFETCLRRHEDVLLRRCCYALLRCRHDVQIRCRGDVPPRCLNNIPSRRRWVFHLRHTWDVAGTYREMSLRCCHDVLLLGGNRTNLKYCQKKSLK